MKHSAENAEHIGDLERNLDDVIRRCNETLGVAYEEYIAKVREQLKSLPKGSKKWWRLNRILLGRSSKRAGIPPLRQPDGEWVLESGEKANLLGKTFEAKSALPEKKFEWRPEPLKESQSSFFLLRRKDTEQILKDINSDKATGPDLLPGRILKECASVLSLPITLLARRLLDLGKWPECWREHWVAPIFKKGSPSDSEKYRGVHLTSVLSKTIERVVSKIIGEYLEKSGAMGDTQWAFRAGHSCRDLIALVTSTWLLHLHAGEKVGVYISDISAAFDRVNSKLLLEKLKATGLHPNILAFLESYLQARKSNVIVDGEHSKIFRLVDSIFQGTVLGPKLWNVFFQDISVAPPPEYKESKFADDLNCFKGFPGSTENEDIRKDLQACQAAVHSWGECNQVIFDKAKEEFCIIHGDDGEGEDFRALGTWMDTSLRMETNIGKMISKARPKVTAILRSRRFYSTIEMIMQYKSHVLSLLELNTGGFYHALDTVLEPLDKLQSHFLKEIGVTEEEAFVRYNLAPLKARRDISMLGLLYKCVHKLAHQDLQKLFPRSSAPQHSYRTKFQAHRHPYQLEESRLGTKHALLRRSIFGLTRVWNRMPREVVGADSVTTMQKRATAMVRASCQQGDIYWADLLSPRPLILRESPLFESLYALAYVP